MLSDSFRLAELGGVTLEIDTNEDGVTVLIRDTNFVDGVLVSRE